MIVLIVFLLILVGATTGCYFICQKMSSLSYAKEQYFTYLQKQKYEKAYQMLDINESKWLTEDNFENALKYSGAQQNQIKATRKSKKKWGIITQWKIIPEGIIEEDFSIYVPKDSTVRINGVELDEEYLQEDVLDSKDEYILPEIFIGTYLLQVDVPYYETVEKKIEVELYSGGASVNLEDLILKEEVSKGLKEKGKEVIENLYTAAINKSGVKGLELDYESQKILDNAYRYLTSSLDSYYYSLEEITLSGFEEFMESPYEEDGKTYLEMFLEYDYECMYEEKNGTDTRLTDGYTDTEITFILKDGEWKVHSIDLGYID